MIASSISMQSNVVSAPKRRSHYFAAAQTAAEILETVLGSLRGTDPSLISQYVLTETKHGEAWLFAVVDDLRIQNYQPWVNALHALSTSLRGKRVFISNTTGFRYAVLLSDRPALPKEIPFPGVRQGSVQIGVKSNGRSLITAWDHLGHVLAAGQTQFGKSNFLRLLAMQARADGFRFLLGDLDGRTFSRLKGDASLIVPIANTHDGFKQVVEAAHIELERRRELFDAAYGQPDNLAEYNAQFDPTPRFDFADAPLSAKGQEGKLPPIMMMLDEFNSVVLGMGGPKGEFAKRATEIAWRGLKFGIHVVLAGQDFSKDIVGPIREQMRTRLCFRVATPDISDVVIGRRGAERIRYPGRAMMPIGTVQTYLAPRDALGRSDQTQGPQVSGEELMRIDKMVNTFAGRADLSGIQEIFGVNERAARRLRDYWASRGLIEKRADANNAWFFVQTPWASKPVRTASERPNGVQTDLTPNPLRQAQHDAFPGREGENGIEQ